MLGSRVIPANVHDPDMSTFWFLPLVRTSGHTWVQAMVDDFSIFEKLLNDNFFIENYFIILKTV